MKSNIKSLPPACDSPIWGYGRILDTIQKAGLFEDSKTFVDLKLNHSESEILANFDKLADNPNFDVLLDFIKENFCHNFHQEMSTWTPDDWREEPEYLKSIKDKRLRYLGTQVNTKWLELSRKCTPELGKDPSSFSKINLPYGFIVPGGRFREIYYWDSYWILTGLLISKMTATANGIVGNFLHQVDRFGHVPNGTRIYYIRRSQPPYLICMMSKYIEKTRDLKFLRANIQTMEREIDFFEKNRRIDYYWNDERYTVFHYSSESSGPRPESYKEDLIEAQENFATIEEQEEYYMHKKAAAESGWDFSSRWYIDQDGGNQGPLTNTKTCYIAPTDLNGLMYKNYRYMAKFHRMVGAEDKAQFYDGKSRDILRSLDELFWCKEEGMWFDIDMLNHKRRYYFYASNLFPLWAEGYEPFRAYSVARSAIKYLKRTGVLEHPGGIPCSVQHTDQQWDYSVWAPLQHYIVYGLKKTGNGEAGALARDIAKTFVKAVLSNVNLNANSCFFEKYDPDKPGFPFNGGEYSVQVGFGWTNGVLIDFINRYGDELVR
eukprot:snap_masked-scaffold300_size216557-processed-gene-0.6 protein:Tk07141 transcript:snap_masked-scaffold300_size216557-processed-gene-0.6-mRNA-1 annotation:"hypothetical protein DAPPUDRAFT_303585"